MKRDVDSEFADLFLTVEKIWPDGKPLQAEIDKLFLRRPEPFSEFQINQTGAVEKIWTTFGKTSPSEQIDMDVNSPMTKQLITEVHGEF